MSGHLTPDVEGVLDVAEGFSLPVSGKWPGTDLEPQAQV